MSSPFHLVCFAALAAAALPSGASAQHVPAPTTAPAPAGRVLVGGGADLLATERGPTTPGLALQVGYERRLGGPGSRVGLRLEGTFWQRGTRYEGSIFGPTGATPVGSVARTRTIGGVNLLGTYRFGPAPARGVRPYVLGGVGVHQLSLRHETDWTRAGGGAGMSKVVVVAPVRVNSAAFTGGLGLDIPVGRRVLFIEGRATLLPTGASRVSQGVTTPLTAGFRF